MEYYIYVKGVKIPLTKKEVDAINQKVKLLFTDFNKKVGKCYYYISKNGYVYCEKDGDMEVDRDLFNVANYCNDRDLMELRALEETLNRLLWRESCKSGELNNKWNGKDHFYIYYDPKSDNFVIGNSSRRNKLGCVYFPTIQDASDALEEVVMPFIGDHPSLLNYYRKISKED